MPADANIVSLRSGTGEPAAARREAPREPPQPPTEKLSSPKAAELHPSRRRWLRWSLFAPAAARLIGGAYWYVTGG